MLYYNHIYWAAMTASKLKLLSNIVILCKVSYQFRIKFTKMSVEKKLTVLMSYFPHQIEEWEAGNREFSASDRLTPLFDEFSLW